MRFGDANTPADGRVRIPGSDTYTRRMDLRFARKAGVAALLIFAVFAGLVIVLSLFGVMSSHLSSVLLWMLVALYLAFGILIVLYRVISRLE